MGFFISGLTLLFVYFKMINHIDWSWIWVLSPLWIGFLVAILISIVAIIVDAILEQKECGVKDKNVLFKGISKKMENIGHLILIKLEKVLK